MFNSDDFRIYGCSISSFEYPEVQLNQYSMATIKGNMQELNLGVEYSVKAKEVSDKFGIGYQVIHIRRDKPTTLAATRNFLYEILTPMQTDTLLEAYPDIVDRIMKNKPVDLSKTKGIKEYTFNVIKSKVIENFKLADLVEEFKGLFSLSVIKKIYDKYTSVEKVKEVIREEPYECLCKLSGIGFKTADSMLLELEKESRASKSKGEKPVLFFGFDLKPSYQRAKACVDYILNENEESGNTFIPVGELKREFESLVPEAMLNLAPILKGDNDVIFDRDSLRVSRKTAYETEKDIAKRIKFALTQNTIWDYELYQFKKIEDFELTSEQFKTMGYVYKHNIAMLVGYAGAGKSSSSKALINALDAHNKKCLLLAPTGRAAKVLSGFTGRDAMTIHRGLGYNPKFGWTYNEENPLEVDVVIADESSMIDIYLFSTLLKAINFSKTKLLLIGDDAQIPSVSAGNILYDLLAWGKIPTVRLDKIFRYGSGGVLTVATDIRESNKYLSESKEPQVFGDDKSYTFFPVAQEKMVKYAVMLYKKLLSQGVEPEDILVMSAYNVGDYGTTVINKILQNIVNPNPKKKIVFGESEYRLNDIVMCVQNDYKAVRYNEEWINENDVAFIANGESGKVIDITHNAMVVKYETETIYYVKSNLKILRLSYCYSIHKAQGGSSKVTILISPKAHTYMLNSNILYVAVTRTREKCYHLGEERTIGTAIKKKENFDRKTNLPMFLEKEGVGNEENRNTE